MAQMRLWTKALGENQYFVWICTEEKGWTISITRTTEGLTIEHFGRKFELLPVTDSDLPEWYTELLEKALAKCPSASSN